MTSWKCGRKTKEALKIVKVLFIAGFKNKARNIKTIVLLKMLKYTLQIKQLLIKAQEKKSFPYWA